MVRGYYRMLRRNLLYTAITRAKDKLILCGEEEAFALPLITQMSISAIQR